MKYENKGKVDELFREIDSLEKTRSEMSAVSSISLELVSGYSLLSIDLIKDKETDRPFLVAKTVSYFDSITDAINARINRLKRELEKL